MSLNFVESLIDKLFYPHKGNEIPLSGKFTGSQNLMKTNMRMNYNILSEFNELLETNCFPLDVPATNLLSSVVKNNFHPFDSSNYCLINRIPKLVIPSFSTIFEDSFHVLSNPAKQFESEPYLNITSNFICETYPRNLFDTQNLTKENQFPTKMPSNPLTSFSTACTASDTPKLDLLQNCCPSLPKQNDELKPQKQIVDSSKTLNQELSNRKAKELQKRSKKRRRRQKKNCLNYTKKASNSPEKNSTRNAERNKLPGIPTSQCTVSESVNVDNGPLCDKTRKVGQTSSVQILLPELSSFFISVESANDDDIDWDSSSDSEWVSTCAEFELSGLFVTNLTAPRTTKCLSKGRVSQLTVPCTYFDHAEVQNLANVLWNVNRTWNESIRELEKKPKLAPKVTFAPDDRLVKILPVEVYERKGEWEIYALERFRFKKRINELEKILSPCLSNEHRRKVFLSLQQTEL